MALRPQGCPWLGSERVFWPSSSSAPTGLQSLPRGAFLTYWLVPYCLPSIFPAGGRDLPCLSPTVPASRTGACSWFLKTPRCPLCHGPSALGRARMLEVCTAEEADRTPASRWREDGAAGRWDLADERVRGENLSQKGSPTRTVV